MADNEEKYCANCKKQTNHIGGICQVCNQNKSSIVKKVVPVVIIVFVIIGIASFIFMKNSKPPVASTNTTIKVEQPVQENSKSESEKLDSLDKEMNTMIETGQLTGVSSDRLQQIQSGFDDLKKRKMKRRGNAYEADDDNGNNKVLINSNIDSEVLNADGYPKIEFNIKKDRVIVFNYGFNVYTKVIDKQSAAFNSLRQSLITNKEMISRLYILGHTDDIGSNEYNNQLSMKRCLSLGEELMGQGLKVINYGFGKNRPISKNASDDDRAENRRIEIIVVKK